MPSRFSIEEAATMARSRGEYWESGPVGQDIRIYTTKQTVGIFEIIFAGFEGKRRGPNMRKAGF